MGQKVNPHGARVGVIFDWSTRWFAEKKDFANHLVEDYKLREMLKEKYYATGISRIDIERSDDARMTVNIFTGKPGMRSWSPRTLPSSWKSASPSAAP